MISYPSSPDWSSGRFFGPTSGATPSFPDAVYLNATEWHRWQLEEQIKLNSAASDQFDQVSKSLGLKTANPYSQFIEIAKSQLATLNS